MIIDGTEVMKSASGSLEGKEQNELKKEEKDGKSEGG